MPLMRSEIASVLISSRASRPEFRKDVNAQDRLVGLPTAFVCLHVRQIAFLHEGVELRDRPHLTPFLLWIGTEQGFRYDLARFATCLIQSEDLGWADLVLALAAAIIGVPLIVGLAARLANFKQEATLRDVKIVCLLRARKRRSPVARTRQTKSQLAFAAARCPSSAPRERSVASGSVTT